MPRTRPVNRSSGHRRRSSLPVFYALLGVLALAGVAVLAARARDLPSPAGDRSATVAVRTVNAPTGLTPEGFYYRGQPDAPVTVVEYSDFQCPACAAYALRYADEIDRRYVETGQVRFVFHDFPLPNHANAPRAATAARCAGEQGAFWSMHDLLFVRQQEWAQDANATRRFGAYAGDLGLDRAAFTGCLSANRYAEPLRQAAAAANRVGIPGTPTFIVAGRQVDTSQLAAAIEAALRARER